MVQAGLAHLLEGVAGQNAARTAIIIAHRLSTVETADRVLVVHDGRIVEDGTPAELITGGGQFARLHGAGGTRSCESRHPLLDFASRSDSAILEQLLSQRIGM